MSENIASNLYESGYRVGIRIIPSVHVPDGRRCTLGKDVFVNPGTYEKLRPLTAEETLRTLALLRGMR